jgi:hypothetical protein
LLLRVDHFNRLIFKFSDHLFFLLLRSTMESSSEFPILAIVLFRSRTCWVHFYNLCFFIDSLILFIHHFPNF